MYLDNKMPSVNISQQIGKVVGSLPNIIAICGPKNSGKTLLANYISLRYSYAKVRFADPLDDAVKALFNFSCEQLSHSYLKHNVDERWGVSPVKALQFFDKEIMKDKMQELLPYTGSKFLTYSLISRLKPVHKYVICDMNHLYEYEELAKFQFSQQSMSFMY
jgi:hypothetical protein